MPASRRGPVAPSPTSGASKRAASVATAAKRAAKPAAAEPPRKEPVRARAPRAAAGGGPGVGEPVGRDLGVLKQVIGFRFRRVQNHLSRRLTAMDGFGGARAGEFSALAIVSANPGLSQGELAQEVGLDKAMIVIVVDELERQLLVRRERAADDRRRNLLFATPLGESTLQAWSGLARENERLVRDALSAAEFRQLSDLLDRIYNRCFNVADE